MLSIPPADESGPNWLESAIQAETAPPEFPDAQLTGYVIFAQWDAGDGFQGITAKTDLPPWAAEGLARYGTRWCLDETDVEAD